MGSVSRDWFGGDVVLLHNPFLINSLFWCWNVIVAPFSPVFNKGILEFLWNQVQGLFVSSTNNVFKDKVNGLAHSEIIINYLMMINFYDGRRVFKYEKVQ